MASTVPQRNSKSSPAARRTSDTDTSTWPAPAAGTMGLRNFTLSTTGAAPNHAASGSMAKAASITSASSSTPG